MRFKIRFFSIELLFIILLLCSRCTKAGFKWMILNFCFWCGFNFSFTASSPWKVLVHFSCDTCFSGVPVCIITPNAHSFCSLAWCACVAAGSTAGNQHASHSQFIGSFQPDTLGSAACRWYSIPSQAARRRLFQDADGAPGTVTASGKRTQGPKVKIYFPPPCISISAAALVLLTPPKSRRKQGLRVSVEERRAQGGWGAATRAGKTKNVYT